MKQGTGSCKITGVDVGEIHVDFFTPSVVPVAKYAYVGSEPGQRFGSSYRNMWGGRVTAAMAALKEAMEEEICVELFGGAADSGSLVIEPKLEDEEGPPSL